MTPLPLRDYTITYMPFVGVGDHPGHTSHAVVTCLHCGPSATVFAGNGPGMHTALDRIIRKHLEEKHAHGPAAGAR